MDYDDEDPKMNANIVHVTDLGLKKKITKRKMHTVVNDLKLRISKSLKDRFKDVNTKPNLMIATLLDPRFKEIPFEQYDLDLDQAVEYAKADALKEILSHEENDSTEDEDSILDAKEYIPDKKVKKI